MSHNITKQDTLLRWANLQMKGHVVSSQYMESHSLHLQSHTSVYVYGNTQPHGAPRTATDLITRVRGAYEQQGRRLVLITRVRGANEQQGRRLVLDMRIRGAVQQFPGS